MVSPVRTIIWPPFLLLALSIVGCRQSPKVVGPVQDTGPDVTLRLGGSKGDHATVETEFTVQADVTGMKLPKGLPEDQKKLLLGPQSMRIWHREERTLTSVESGKLTFESKVVDAKAEGQGTLQAAAEANVLGEKGKTYFRVFDSRNRRLDSEPGDEPTPLSFEYPMSKIAPNTRWSAETTVASQKAVANYVYVGPETVGGHVCALITMTLSGNERLTSPKPFKIWIDRTNGWLVKGEGTASLQDADKGLKTTVTFRFKTL